MAAIFNQYKWKHCAIIWDDGGLYWPRLAPTVRDILIEGGVTVIDITMSNYENTKGALLEAEDTARSKCSAQLTF